MNRLALLLTVALVCNCLSVHGFLDLYRLDGSWHSYSICDMFLGPESDPNGVLHSVTCGLGVATNTVATNTIQGQSLACDGKTPTTHGKDFIYLELAQQGSVVTRLPGVHRGQGIYQFDAWSTVSDCIWSFSTLAQYHATFRISSSCRRGPGFGRKLLFTLQSTPLKSWFRLNSIQCM